MTTSRAPRAAAAWRLMFDFLMKSSPQRLESLERRGLTPNDSRALFALTKEGKPIGQLARELGCDPSNATWLLDRLEDSGLAERRASATDRRVKLVALTAKGVKAAAEIMEEYRRPPPQLTQLTAKELDELIAVLEKLSSI